MAQGTFGVGGLLVEDSTGRVLKTMHNNVVRPLTHGDHAVYDPTAHGERQLIEWYFENRNAESLPPPAACTIISSIDPCAMCAGAVVSAGFKVGVVAPDDWAGVNHDGRLKSFDRLLKEKSVPSSFGYYEIEGNERPFLGNPDVVFSDTPISREVARACSEVFLANLEEVKARVNNGRLPQGELSNPTKLPLDSPIRTRLSAVFPDFLSPGLDGTVDLAENLRRLLEDLAGSSAGAGNAVGFVDPFGNLLAASADTFEVSPIATALTNTIQMYTRARYELLENPETRSQTERHLASPSQGAFVFLHLPEPDSALTVQDLGAFGSTMEGPPPDGGSDIFQFFGEPHQGALDGLMRRIAHLPPFYSSEEAGVYSTRIGALPTRISV